MSLIRALETGGSLAERIPYSLVALVSRFAVTSVFWRSGQTKAHGVMIKDETFVLFRDEYKVPLLPPDVAAYISTTFEHLLSRAARRRLRLAAVAARTVRDDDGHPAFRLSER
jgi:putative oxidoreductase